MNIRSRDIQYALGLQSHELKHLVHRGVVKVRNLAKGTGNVSFYSREEAFVICVATELLRLGLKPAHIKSVSNYLQRGLKSTLYIENQRAGPVLTVAEPKTKGEAPSYLIMIPSASSGGRSYSISLCSQKDIEHFMNNSEGNPRIFLAVPLRPLLEKLADIESSSKE